MKIFECWLSLAIKRLDKGQFVSVITNTFAKQALVEYRNRWSIEVFFQALKKRGFDLEASHLKDPQRLCKLFALCAMAFTICFVQGKFDHRTQPIPRKNHGYKAYSFFRKGLDNIRDAFRLDHELTHFLQWIFSKFQQNKERWHEGSKIVV